MIVSSGLLCLGLTIFGSFEILAVLAYFAALHHFNIWTVSLVTGICVLAPTGYCLFRLITEIISFVKFNRGEQNPLDQRSKKERVIALVTIVLSLLIFSGLSGYSFYLSEHAVGPCKTGKQCSPQLFLFSVAFGIAFFFTVNKLQQSAPQNSNPAPNSNYETLQEESHP
ncbi:hypothetical protein FO519_006668 [Halicephalobus sp. NKZ332]|nr:hypothetical protein FO519_006668 [Halicephalobus sp. NKZ332]